MDEKEMRRELQEFLARKLKKDGKTIKQIAEELGISQKEVRELLK